MAAKPGDGIVVAGVAERLDVPVLERQLPSAAQVVVDLGLRRDGVVERLVQGPREPFPDGVESNGYVRVGGDQLGHGPSRVLRVRSIASTMNRREASPDRHGRLGGVLGRGR